MRFTHFFVDHPIFASVVSILITLLGAIAYLSLPVAQYPEIAPPTVQVTANYPGASAETVAATDDIWGKPLRAARRSVSCVVSIDMCALAAAQQERAQLQAAMQASAREYEADQLRQAQRLSIGDRRRQGPVESGSGARGRGARDGTWCRHYEGDTWRNSNGK